MSRKGKGFVHVLKNEIEPDKLLTDAAMWTEVNLVSLIRGNTDGSFDVVVTKDESCPGQAHLVVGEYRTIRFQLIDQTYRFVRGKVDSITDTKLSIGPCLKIRIIDAKMLTP